MPPTLQTQNPSIDAWFVREVWVYHGALRGYLLGRFPTRIEVDDLMQETFRRVLRAREAGEIQVSKAYLCTIARNIAYDLLRREKIISFEGVEEMERLPVIDHAPGVTETVVARQELELLQEAIQSLPERCREVFILRKMHHLPQREIAARLGITENTVEAQVASGLRRCVQFFESKGITPQARRAKP